MIGGLGRERVNSKENNLSSFRRATEKLKGRFLGSRGQDAEGLIQNKGECDVRKLIEGGQEEREKDLIGDSGTDLIHSEVVDPDFSVLF